MFNDIRKIVYSVAILFFIGFMASIVLKFFYNIDISIPFEKFFQFADIFSMFVFGVVSIVLIALMINFFGKKPQPKKLEGDILFKIENSGANFILAAIGGLVFFLIFGFVFYENIKDPQTDLNLGGNGLFISGFFTVLALFLVIAGTVKAFKKETVLIITTKGFIYNPAGISTDVIEWSDITDIEETTIQSSTGRRSVTEPVLAIKLVDPDLAFRPAMNPLASKILQPLFKFRQQEAGTHLFFSRRLLGDNYDKVYEIMKAQLARKTTHRTTSLPPQ